MKTTDDFKALARALAFCVAVAGPACAGEPFPFDVQNGDQDADAGDDAPGDHGGGDDPGHPDAIQEVVALHILQPSGQGEVLVSGPVDFVFRYEGPSALGATITLSVTGMEPVAILVEQPGEYSMTLTPVPDIQGSRLARLEAVTNDSREADDDLLIMIDSLPPEIRFEAPTPAAGQAVDGEIPVRVRVTDSGSGVHGVEVKVMDFTWKWTAQTGVGVAEVDSQTERAIAVPVTGWASGFYTIEVTARDAVEGRAAIALRKVAVSRDVEFAAEASGIQAGSSGGIGGDGIRIGHGDDRQWGIVTSNGVYLNTPDGVRTVSPGLECDSGVLWAVTDVDGDGRDDFAAYCGDPDAPRLAFMMQQDEGIFSETTIHAGYLGIMDLAVGDLNGDGWSDVAFLADKAGQLSLVNVILSQTDEDGSLSGWGPIVEYLGGYTPDNVEIGTFSDNDRNALLVSSSIMKLTTVFPVDTGGALNMGEDTYWGDSPFLVTGTANFCDMDAPHNSLLGVDNPACWPNLYVGRVNQESSRLGVQALENGWFDTSDIDVGDADGNGTGDIALLCRRANMILFFKGGPDCAAFEFADRGMAMVSGGATNIWFSDWDHDGYKDIFSMTPAGIGVTRFLPDERGGHFNGSYQLRLPLSPADVDTGHFLKPADESRSGFLDAAVLVGPDIAILSSDEILGQPLLQTSFVEPLLDEDGACVASGTPTIVDDGMVGSFILSGAKAPLAMSIGRFGSPAPVEGMDARNTLDGIVLATNAHPTIQTPESSVAVVFGEIDHTQGCIARSEIQAGYEPKLVASGLFDVRKGVHGFHDAAFIWNEGPPAVNPKFYLQAWRGNGDGTFSYETEIEEEGEQVTVTIPALPIENKRRPGVMFPFQLRRTLKEYLDGGYVAPDLIVGNMGTGDFTVFLGTGDGRFLAKTDGSLDYAVGLAPISIAAGYLDAPVDGSAGLSETEAELPDVVTLTREGNTSVLVISHAMTREELAERELDVGFEVPQSFIIYQPGAGTQMTPVPKPVAVDLADMNRDGRLDVVVLDQARGSILVFRNEGDLKFSQPVEFFGGREPIQMRAADVDDDGCTDVLTADTVGMTVSIMHNRACSATDAP